MRMKGRPGSLIVTMLVVALFAAACGDDPRPGDTNIRGDGSEPGGDEHDAPPDLDAPPPVTIRFGGDSAELQPWSWCYDTACADGAPPEDLVEVGSADEVLVQYPLSGWTFEASFTPAGDECGRIQKVTLERTDQGFLVEPVGYAGTYDVELFGRGGGDLVTSFRWKTPVDGPLPDPEARAAILADNDGRVDSYGVELSVSNLAETPERATATITVEAEDGDSHSFEAKPSHHNCFPEGSLYWDGPDDEGLAAAKLGDGSGSFTYTVELFLDGERYVATAEWPEDIIEGNEPSVNLEFSPPLPALE